VPEQRVAWSPQPGPQEALVTCPIEDVFFGGARGGGKSDGLLGDFGIHAGEYGAAAQGILFRKTFPRLEELIRRSLEIYKPMGWTYTSGDHIWTAPNGAVLKLRFLDSDQDVAAYVGHQYTWMGFDQVEEWQTPYAVDQLWGSLRSAHGVPCVRRLTGNPPAPAWVKQRYIDPHPMGMVVFKYQPLPTERPDVWITAVFIPSKLEDNPLLMANDPGYDARLAAVGDPRVYKAWRHGDWSVQLGQVFEEWRSDLHVLPAFHPPRGWPLAGGMDWGYRNPGCFALAALGPDGEVIVVEELYFRQRTGLDVGEAVGHLCRPRGQVEYIAGDEQMWYKTGVSAPTIAEEVQVGIFKAYGGPREEAPRLIAATHGRGSRAAKLVVMHRYLAWKADAKGKVQPWGLPLLRFTANCKYLIRSLPALPYDPHRPEDSDTKADDHGYDAMGALLMSRPPLGERQERPPEKDRHPGFDVKRRKRAAARWEQHWQEPERGWPGAHTGFHLPRPDELTPVEDDER
jgi:hypothetical protein